MKRTTPKRRALTSREKLMREKYTRLAKYSPSHYNLFLSVGVQSFRVGRGFETIRESEWTRDMLAAALAKIEL